MTNENIFNDERINSGRGKVFRETLIFALVFTAFYIAVYMIPLFSTLVVSKAILRSTFLTWIGSLLVLIIIIAIGELRYLDAKKDEMRDSQKCAYYDKAFIIFIYSAICIYCINIALILANYRMAIAFLPHNDYISKLLLTGGIFLIMRLKSRKITLNYTVIDEGNKTYYRRIFKNILKLGEMCAMFTGFSLAVYVFILFPTGNFNERTLSLMMTVLVTGLESWITLSLYYLMISASEKISLSATENGRISLSPTFHLILFCTASAITSGIGLISALGGTVNSVESVTFITNINRAVSNYIPLFVSLFALYIASELETVDVKIMRIAQTLTLARIINLSPSMILNALILKSVMNGSLDVEFRNTLNTVSIALSMIFSLFSLVTALILFFGTRKVCKSKLLSRAFPYLFLSLQLVQVACTIITTLGFKNLQGIISAASLVLYVLYLVAFFALKRKVNKTVEVTDKTNII